MKRSWIGVGILAVLLIGAIAVTWSMDAVHRPVEALLLEARDAALEGNWSQAQTLAGEAGLRWEKWRNLRLCFADHGPVEDVESCFAQLMAYSIAGEETDFAALAGETARRVQAMSQAHGLTLWNLL